MKNVSDAGVMANVEAMLASSGRGIGPDIVIVVSSSCDGADFWQKRLTGSDGIKGSGAVVKDSAVVLSVSESNWNGPAGNGLGTINAFYQAGYKAEEQGLISADKNDIDAIFRAFLCYAAGKSVFMFHTAGKGTRLSPLTAAEHNSKSRIKLPGEVQTEEGLRPITVLESAIRAASIYAASREDRLSVFWADQVVLNELDAKFDGGHDVEIFVQSVPMDGGISSYGFVIPKENGECLLREKLDEGRIRKMFPGISNTILRSIGSFSLSFEFFACLADSEREAVLARKGELNTDRDWWQAFTSDIEEYTDLALEKAVPSDLAEKRWDKTRSIREKFCSQGKTARNKRGLIGFKDVGAGSLWLDYGRNSCLAHNTLILTKNSPDAEAARAFFKANESFIRYLHTDTMDIKDSIVIGSRIGKGKIRNCVIISSDIDEIHAEGSLIVGSKVMQLNSIGALCYNVGSFKEDLKEADVLVNVFLPGEERVIMRTTLYRDGQIDWMNNEKVMGNKFSYGELADKIKDTPEEDLENARRDEIKRRTCNG
ncbi:MAG: hypothetical protein WCV56_05020 [Candidatus Omnitrophota bacterium]